MYTVTVEQDGRFWMVTVPAIERSTQARSLDEVDLMARELITIMTGETDVELVVTYVLPASVREHLERVDEARRAEESARTLAAAELRAAAKELRAAHLSYKDVGAALSVSHQRAHQLVNS